MLFKRRPRVIFNDDTCSLRLVTPPHSPASVAQALRHLAGSQVDCLCWCLYSGDVAYSWPSKVSENYFALAERDTRLDIWKPELNLMLSLYRQGIDYLPHLVDMAHRQDLTFYGSFRMNDAHQKSAPDSYLAGEFWRQHPEYRLWEVTAGQTYYNAAQDYSFPEVRQRKLDAIREVLDWYDLDGIELDWCRNPYAFQPSEAWAKRRILTAFTKAVRELLATASQARGRDLGLILRVPFKEETRRLAGIDVETWIERGLMDVLVMSNLTNANSLTLGEWPQRCRNRGILFYPSLEAGPAQNAPRHNHVVPETVAEAILRQRSMAQNYLAQGGDGIYMFNYACRLFETRRTPEDFARLAAVLSELGSQKTLRPAAKQYTFWESLPVQLESLRPPQYHQTIPFALRDPALRRHTTRVVLRFRQVAERNPHAFASYWQKPIMAPDWVQYILNGKPVPAGWITRTRQPAGKIPSGFTLRVHELIEIAVPASRLACGENLLAFLIPRFPGPRDPYVYVYELTVDVVPA